MNEEIENLEIEVLVQRETIRILTMRLDNLTMEMKDHVNNVVRHS